MVSAKVRDVMRILAGMVAAAACGIALLTTVTAHAASMVRIAGDPVRTTSGLVAGTRLASGIRAYLGVPYAKPPVRELRWQPPQPLHWDGIWNADRMGPECIQVLRQHDINHYFGEEPTAEDCLYLNIWTTANAKAGAELPVIAFIYGGGGTIGSAGMAHYDGENVAKHGAVYVNFNYRVGILGFMAHPELTREQGGHSGNYAYLDQNAALKWIHDNIATFGGDPDRVLIAGQSAGASSVAAQIMSPLSKGLFSSAMMSSGCNFTRDGMPLAEGERIGLDIQKRLGAANIEALRNLPADKILAQQAETQNLNNNPGVVVSAVVDGHFWTGTKAQMLAAHAGSAVPIIAGSNGDDNDIERYALTRAHTVAEYQALARSMYGADAEAFLQLFPGNSDAEVQASARRAAMESGFVAGSRTCGELQARYNQAPTFVDLFVRRHPYTPGVKIADQDTATIGAYHNADIPYWFGTLEAFNLFRPTRNWTALDRDLSERMMHGLIAFARTSKPDTPDLSWPAWTTDSPRYMVFGESVEVRTMNLTRMDWLAAHPPAPVAPLAPVRTGPRD
jgi:para-nitrobenzyl esterase